MLSLFDLRVKKRKYLENGDLEIQLENKEKFTLDPMHEKVRVFEVGYLLSPEEYSCFTQDNLVKKCRDKAMRLLSRRLHARGELRKKLFVIEGINGRIIDNILDELASLSYLNDSLYAESLAKELYQKGFGQRRISQKLYERGLSKEDIRQSLEQVFGENESESNDEVLLRLAQKKLKSLSRETDLFKKRQKLFRYLMSRGWSSVKISKVIAELMG